jgi:hypothetical protein
MPDAPTPAPRGLRRIPSDVRRSRNSRQLNSPHTDSCPGRVHRAGYGYQLETHPAASARNSAFWCTLGQGAIAFEGWFVDVTPSANVDAGPRDPACFRGSRPRREHASEYEGVSVVVPACRRSDCRRSYVAGRHGGRRLRSQVAMGTEGLRRVRRDRARASLSHQGDGLGHATGIPSMLPQAR